ncbi:TauD/TfdA family dioxygenase [Nocardia mangyaensis]|uniref:TauD/TfdA family dioxygenase n=1 Tax=Nocardia mangyaensis TaxID=2213200 RepID=UPI0026766289|nr:TauD/TfdA family dioxygenase [Nocardia mangyaensis]MDO3645918.1 TauD/TfdA family dioxygenase [Nocardia mangyaensis]
MQDNSFAERFPVHAMRGDATAVREYLRTTARAELLEHGAVLLRDTGLTETDELESMSRELLGTLYEAYTGGVVPRSNHSRYVFSSTELNGLFNLKLHNEMAYQRNYPRYITFFCATPSRWGGQTPIAHESDIQRELGGEFGARIAGDNVVYTRRYLSRDRHPSRVRRFPSMFVSWQDSFGTEDRAEVETKCAELELKFEWSAEQTLEVRSVLPAFRTLPETGREVFFNQVLTQNFSRGGLGAAGYAAHRLFGFSTASAPRHSAFEREGELTSADVATLNRAYTRAEVSFRWRRGDWMLVDNLQAMHARRRFLGERSIWVVMGE